MPETSYRRLTLLAGSNRIGNETGVDLRKPSASAAFGSTLTPSSVKPAALYFRYICSSTGISCRHGPHQLAQKLISTTCPFRSLSDRSLLAAECSWKPGAGAPGAIVAAGAARVHARARPRPSTRVAV